MPGGLCGVGGHLVTICPKRDGWQTSCRQDWGYLESPPSHRDEDPWKGKESGVRKDWAGLADLTNKSTGSPIKFVHNNE